MNRTAADRRRDVYGRAEYEDRAVERLDGGTDSDGYLASVPEPGQTAEEFRAGIEDRIPAYRRSFRLVPFAGGEAVLSVPSVETLARYLETTFLNAHSEVSAPREIYWGHFDQFGERVDAQQVLGELLDLTTIDLLLTVGLLGARMFSGRRDTLPQLGSFSRRAVAFSTSYYAGDVEERAALKRILSVVAHAAGHALGMAHCIFYRCAMNGTLAMDELDRRPLAFCPVCEDKIAIALGGDPRRRRILLANFFREIGLPEESARLGA